MKKIHKILIVLVVVLTVSIAGTVAMSSTAGEPVLSQTDVVSSSQGRWTLEEVLARCPAYRDYIEVLQSQAEVTDSSQGNVTLEDVLAQCPAYRDYIEVLQSQADDID